jgi:hypothetical protein
VSNAELTQKEKDLCLACAQKVFETGMFADEAFEHFWNSLPTPTRDAKEAGCVPVLVIEMNILRLSRYVDLLMYPDTLYSICTGKLSLKDKNPRSHEFQTYWIWVNGDVEFSDSDGLREHLENGTTTLFEVIWTLFQYPLEGDEHGLYPVSGVGDHIDFACPGNYVQGPDDEDDMSDFAVVGRASTFIVLRFWHGTIDEAVEHFTS